MNSEKKRENEEKTENFEQEKHNSLKNNCWGK